jgi:hypothetical protein
LEKNGISKAIKNCDKNFTTLVTRDELKYGAAGQQYFRITTGWRIYNGNSCR